MKTEHENRVKVEMENNIYVLHVMYAKLLQLVLVYELYVRCRQVAWYTLYLVINWVHQHMCNQDRASYSSSCKINLCCVHMQLVKILNLEFFSCIFQKEQIDSCFVFLYGITILDSLYHSVVCKDVNKPPHLVAISQFQYLCVLQN